MSIDGGLPRSRSEWPPEVLEATAKFSCGDIVEDPPFFYFADPAYGVMSRTKQYADEEFVGPEIIQDEEYAAPFGVITSQTCDVGEVDFDPPLRPFVSISPVVDGSGLNGGTRKLLLAGKRVAAYFHVPELVNIRDGFWVADFRLEMPVEKSWLVGRLPIRGFGEDRARLIPKVLNDIRDRPAWAEVVSNVLQPTLLSALKDLKKEDSVLFEAVVREIDEVGLKSDSRLAPTWIKFAAFVSAEVSASVSDWWHAVCDDLRKAASNSGIGFHATEIINLNECSVLAYREYVGASLTRFSPV